MGVFGHGSFDNDDAVDWLGELDALATVREALVLDGDFFEIDEASEAYAASAVIAACASGKRGIVPKSVFAEFATQPQTLQAQLVTAAITAAKLATTSRKSELRQAGNHKPLGAAGATLIAALEKHAKRLGGSAKRRPKGIPKSARWDRDYEMWPSGPRDARGRWHGEVCLWRADGTLQQRCEHVRGKPHGAFTRYHESGEVSRTGFLDHNKLDGLDTCFRTSKPSSDNLLDGRYDRRIARLETEYRAGVSVAQRYYDAKGNQLVYTGEPIPKRPRAVPSNAVFAETQWSTGELDRRGRPHGAWRYWDRRGKPVLQIEWNAGVQAGRRTTHTR